MHDPWTEAALIALTSVVSGVFALSVLWVFIGRKSAPRPRDALRAEIEETVFLFDKDKLIDATEPARTLLDTTPAGATEWARLSLFLETRFPGFRSKFNELSEKGRLELTGRSAHAGGSPLHLVAENVNGLARITVTDPGAEGRGVLVDGLSQRALEDELDLLRHTLDHSPMLTWREDESGVITWANKAYVMASGALDASGDAFCWPLPHLFDSQECSAQPGPRRVQITSDGTRNWFDCHICPLPDGMLHFALPADATARAEQALRDFVQTLTRTFADLPIGLAIFDRQRQLQLFNPVLTDLLQLAPEFLTMRPTLHTFLDRLRETRMMPEPKDYRTWRLQMTELENAAAAGLHSEMWSLPNGQTYRVTGRPHPDGAVAFLFEDISSEISLTRRFRAELEMTQEVLDLMDEAVAVFHGSGDLALSNDAYARLWCVEPEATLGRVTLGASIRIWQDGCEPSGFWARGRDLENRIGTRETVREDLLMRDGSRLDCRFSTLAGGALLVRFARKDKDTDTPETVARNEPALVVNR